MTPDLNPLFEAWRDVLDSDDVDGAWRLWGDYWKAEPWQLAMALGYPVLPERVLGALLEHNPLEVNWLASTLGSGGGTIDWERALDWRERTSDRAQLTKEMRSGFGVVLNQYVTMSSMLRRDTDLLGSTQNLLLALLERDPTIVHHSTQSIPRGTLFEFACHPKAGCWLARSGLNIDQVIHDGVSNNRHLGLAIRVRGVGDSVQHADDLEQWKARHPQFREAWDRIAAQDLALIQQQEDWFDTWLPTKHWQGSPLQAWCTQVGLGQTRTTPSPLQHPVMAPSAGDGVYNPIRAAENYEKTLGVMPKPGLAFGRAQIANNQLRSELAKRNPHVPRATLDCGLDPWARGFHYKRDWAGEAMATREGAEHAQALMAIDRRVINAVMNWPLREVVDWILKEPSWRTWRDRHGENLLQIAVARENVMDRDLFLPKALLLKLARTVPALLTDANGAGETPLERMRVPDASKAAARRDMLTRQVPKSHKAPAGRPRPGL